MPWPEDSYTSIESIIQNIYRKMKRQLINLSLFAAAAVCACPAWAVPAKPGIHTITTADGSELHVQLVGDEFFHQYLTEDGIPIFERDGNFYFGDVDASGNVRVSDIKVTDAGLLQRGSQRICLKPRHECSGQEPEPTGSQGSAPRDAGADDSRSEHSVQG